MAGPPAKKQKQREIEMLQDSGDEEEREEGDGVYDAKQEMELYLQDRSKAKSNCNRFPKLARAAKRCLCIPATSMPSERIFSTAGYIVNKRRSSLLPDISVWLYRAVNYWLDSASNYVTKKSA